MTSSPSSSDSALSDRLSPVPVVLTIAGSDSSGGAGIQADLKTIYALGGFGCVAITAVTAQNTRGVDGAEYMRPDFVAQQIQSVADDYPIDAIKIGMVGSASIADAIAGKVEALSLPVPVVWDPVMVASSGSSLVDGHSGATDGFIKLARCADALTPNGRELVGLCDMVGVAVPATLREHLAASVGDASAEDNQTPAAEGGAGDSADQSSSLSSAIAEAASALSATLGTVIVVTGGPDNGFGDNGPKVTEVVAEQGETVFLSHNRVDTTNTHGTGCTFSSALATYAALRVYESNKDGVVASGKGSGTLDCDWRGAVQDAATWTRRALIAADDLDLAIGLHRNRDLSGTPQPAHVKGNAPLDHFWEMR